MRIESSDVSSIARYQLSSFLVTYNTYDTTEQTQMLRHRSTTTATGLMLPCRQDVAMMLKQEERPRDKQSTIQWYEFHFTSIQRTSSMNYFAVRKTTQHKLPQLKLGPTIYAIGPPVIRAKIRSISHKSQ